MKMMENSGKCNICLDTLINPIPLEAANGNHLSKLHEIVPELNWTKSFPLCSNCSKELDAAFNFRLKCLKSLVRFKDEIETKPDENSENKCKTKSRQPVFEAQISISSNSAVCTGKNDSASYATRKTLTPEKKIVGKKSHCSPGKPNIYTCQSCTNSFPSLSELVNHCETVHGLMKNEVKPYSCTECRKRFKSSTYLKQHINYHKGIRPEVCTYCGKAFYTKTELNIHEKIHLNQRNYTCELCNKSFNTSKNLSKHKLFVHTDSSRWNYVCGFCNKRFPQKSNMVDHVRRHKGEKLFQCQLCEKKFGDKITLQKHMLSHSNIRNYKCSECDKEYKDKRYMEIHMAKIHSIGNAKVPVKTKKHFCHVCPKSYFDKNKLTRHMYKHTGEKPFSCDNCDKSFIDKTYLANHVKNSHVDATV